MRSLYLLVLVCWTGCLAQSPYRLPTTVRPSKYVVDLVVPDEVFQRADYYSFTGTVAITFTVQSSTSEIKLHRGVNVAIASSSLSGTSTITSTNYNSTYEIVTFTTSAALVPSTTYTLTIVYTAVLEESSMRGFYKSKYQDETDTTVYLVTTQFEATYARFAFPCFDEPNFKSSFVLTITHPSSQTALSNTAGTTSVIGTTTTKTTFLETPVMSTYLVAFVVSTFTCSEGDSIELTVPHRVCSRKEEESDRAWAVEIGPPIIRALESLTGIKYGQSILKMDQIALPDFSSGAMENWGLVTYRETGLLWSTADSSNSYKKSIALVIAHEFTHMWFGNLVTCQWWDYLFLNEGFARFYQYFGAALTKQLLDWELEKHFNVEQLHTALLTDSSIGAQALTSSSSSPSQVSNKFGTITYNKGASILRMIETVIMGPDNFIYGLRKYLTDNAYTGAVPDALWTALAEYVPDVALPTGVTFKTVITNWVDKSGHPVVTVTASGNDVILSQKRFLLSGTDDTEYYIPISYTLSSDTTKFSNTTVKTWLVPGSSLTIKDALKDNSWIILNNRQSGFYRVNYDSSLWASLKSYLHSNTLNIDVLNRAQIVSDTYNFARASEGTHLSDYSYKDVMGVLSYLGHETDYYPWYAAIVGNNHILQRIGYESAEGKKYINWMLGLLEAVYATVPFDVIDENNQVYTMKQVLILTRVCRYRESTCVSKAKELFASYKADPTKKIPKNFRSFVYCTALRESDNPESDFNFLWGVFKETKLMTEVITIYSGLGCTGSKDVLKTFLGKTITATEGIRLQDFSSAWSYVYSSSSLGAEAALEFIVERYADINAYYSNQAQSMISNIAGYLYSEEQLTLLETLAKIDVLKSSAESALSTARSNIAWAAKRRIEMNDYFTSSGVSFRSSLVVVFVIMIVQRLFA